MDVTDAISGELYDAVRKITEKQIKYEVLWNSIQSHPKQISLINSTFLN